MRKISSHDPISNKTVSKYYKYRSLTDTLQPSANKLYYPEYVSHYDNGMFCDWNGVEVVCHGYVLSANTASALTVNEAAAVTYKWVIESDDSLYANGGIEHTFTSQGLFIGMNLMGSPIPDPSADPYNYMNGVETQTIFFNNSRQTVKKINNYYSSDSRINDVQHQNYIVRKRYNSLTAGVAPWDEHDFANFDVVSYSIFTRWDHLDLTETREYDLVNNKEMLSTVSYTYGTTNYVQPTAITTNNSDGTNAKKEMKFPADFTGLTVCSTMVTKNIKEPLIEEKVYKNTKLLYQTNHDYKNWSGNIFTPEFQKSIKGTASQETRIRFYQYDAKGNALEFSKENDARITYVWDYNSTLPIAEVTNASWGAGIAYTSFEAEGKGGWTFSGTPGSDATAPTGNKSYLITSNSITYAGTLTSGKKYHITYWAKSGSVLVNSVAGTSIITKNGWTLYRRIITYSGSGGFTVSGTGYIDELRLFPEGAFIKTYTYTPEVGITSSADVNGLYQKYEYDAFNRLLRVRDMDNNILKQYEYKYGSDLTGCGNTTANWQVTGNQRCAINNVQNNNYTGIKEQEELDLNNCSATYGQKRWTSMGTYPQCAAVANCSGSDKRVINGVCYTGCKQLIRSKYIGNLSWKCTFRYHWVQDGYSGPEFEENSSYQCSGPLCGS